MEKRSIGVRRDQDPIFIIQAQFYAIGVVHNPVVILFIHEAQDCAFVLPSAIDRRWARWKLGQTAFDVQQGRMMLGKQCKTVAIAICPSMTGWKAGKIKSPPPLKARRTLGSSAASMSA